jgi:hypothetical protein
MWIWWYDRQGCIQSEGIDFVRDLPSFFLLLFAFQRFTLDDWGFKSNVDKQLCVIHNTAKDTDGNLIEPKDEIDLEVGSETVKLKLNQILHSGYTLFGRASKTLVASSDSNPRLVAKISWPEISRENEAIIINEARDKAKGNRHVLEHLPTVICSDDIEGSDTGRIRTNLGLDITGSGWGSGPRKLRIIVFQRLGDILSLKGEKFVQAWLECVRCEPIRLLQTTCFPFPML